MSLQAIRQPPIRESSKERMKVFVHETFDEIGEECWQELWSRAEVASVFARYEWLVAWWRTCAQERLLRLYVAREKNRVLAILPTAWPHESKLSREPVVLVGNEHADYAAILVDRKRPDALATLLTVLGGDLPAYATFRIADVRSDSTYAGLFARFARPWWSNWQPEGVVPCPRATLGRDRLNKLLKKKSLRRHSNGLAKLGTLKVRHMQSAAEILPRLDTFFAQHVERWSRTASPSLFLREYNRKLYREWARCLAPTGHLVYTEITLDETPVACHFGFISEGDLVWYKPSFAIDLAKHSPGEVLIRELLLLAGTLGLAGMDFTRGAEAFKQRFADQQRLAVTYLHHGRHRTSVQRRAQRWLKHMLRRSLQRF